ncbi:MAG: type I DNA topoisomerase [Deltaproteobacteria bacterium]|nr:type I DNA topoisomerase [Deltaproteobacteria bacterium]
MSRSLIVVESPAKARTISKYLGKGHQVKASIGHVKDLPRKRLGVDIDNDFEPEYVVIRGKKKILDEIRKEASKADQVLLAPDPDREGEAIAWHIAQEVAKVNSKVFRVLFHEVTPKAVREAISKPGSLDQNKYDSQQARRVLDRLVGYEISPLLWRKVSQGLSAGRVQSVAVRLVVQREEEIKAFISEEYWTITALLDASNPPEIKARLVLENGKKFKAGNKEKADLVVASLRKGEFKISRVEKKKRTRRAPPPFITSTMQQEAARKLRFTAKRTMRVAQRLYEGLEVGGEGPMGLITYMRTDSTRVSESAIAEARSFIEQSLGKEYLPEKPVRYKSKNKAQDAHEAIRPTSVTASPESLKGKLPRDEMRLYSLIWKRFVASQMKPAVYDQIVIDISCGAFLLRATGSVLAFPGFSTLYVEGKDEEEEQENTGLPKVEVGQVLVLKDIISEQKFTQPPPRYLESSLIKELEEKGIGRPSTYATILSTIQDKGYVEKIEGRFHPTELGELVTGLLIENFPKIMDISFTASMEDRLDKVQEGAVDWKQMLRDFYSHFKEAVEKARTDMKNLKQEVEKTDIVCEKCGKPMVVRWGKAGKFLACSGYPECKNTKEFKRDESGTIQAVEPETTDEVCEKCGSPMVVKKGRFGKFLACSSYPNCRNTKPINSGFSCPVDGCNGFLVERRSKGGRRFWGCSNYPKCTFATWESPKKETCENCNSPYLLTRMSRGKTLKRCPVCGFGDPPPKRRSYNPKTGHKKKRDTAVKGGKTAHTRT